MRRPILILCGMGLAALLACGGGGGGGSSASTRSTTAATSLVYSSSAGSSSWRLVEDGASTGTRKVFDLYAPAGTTGQGFTVVLTTDPGNATWSPVSGTRYAVQTLFSSTAVSLASVSGGALRIVFGQAPGTAVSYDGSPVVQVALNLASGATVGGVTLTATQAGNLVGTSPAEVTVAVGSLQAE